MKRNKSHVLQTTSNRIQVNKIFIALILFLLMANAYGQAVIVQPIGTSIDGGKHYLKMQVWNCTDKDILVHLADLPWGQYRLGLVLYPGGKLAGEPLKESIPVGDSPSTEMRIPKNSHIDGQIVLEQRFLDISRYEEHGNLLIFWEYDLSLITGGKSQIVGGMIPLNEKSLLNSERRIGCEPEK